MHERNGLYHGKYKVIRHFIKYIIPYNIIVIKIKQTFFYFSAYPTIVNITNCIVIRRRKGALVCAP